MNPNRYRFGHQLTESEALGLDENELVCVTFYNGTDEDSIVYQVIGRVGVLPYASIWDVGEEFMTNIKRVHVG